MQRRYVKSDHCKHDYSILVRELTEDEKLFTDYTAIWRCRKCDREITKKKGKLKIERSKIKNKKGVTNAFSFGVKQK